MRSQWLQPTYFNGAALVYNKYLEPLIASKSDFIDEQAELVLKKARNISADDLTQLIDWVSTKGQALTGVSTGASSATKSTASTPAADEVQDEKPEEPEVVSSTEAEPAETKKAQ